MKLCRPCGKENPDDYKFCRRCGQLLVASASATPEAVPATNRAFPAAEQQNAPSEQTKVRGDFHEGLSPARSKSLLTNCPFCAEEILVGAKKCKHCGEFVDLSGSASAGGAVRTAEAVPEPQGKDKLEQRGSKLTSQQKLYFQQEYDKQSRNPSTALILTLLLGGAGAHRFYLRQWGWGAAYILFAWTFIPVCVALVECFFIRARTEKYNKQVAQQILDKMNIIFSEPELAMAARAST
jgi:TM2 domain-containing membrane protein YozV